MDNQTFELLKRKFFHNEDSESLEQSKQTCSPYVASKIDLILGHPRYENPNTALDVTRFTSQFRNASSPKERLNEVVATYLLFLANSLCQQTFSRPFTHPGDIEGEFYAVHLYKMTVFSVLTLAYDIHWKSEYFLFLDEAIIDLLLGKVEALRSLVEKLGVRFQSAIEAESVFPYLEYQNNRHFGPYVWRALHWMAEAIAVRPNQRHDLVLAKRLWREFVVKSLHRTLQCGICMHHYRTIALESNFEQRLMHAPDEDYPKIWFELHNRVNDLTASARYSESELEKDRVFLAAGL